MNRPPRISPITLSCKFKMWVFKKDGTIRYEGPWFSNTMLNQGLDHCMQNNTWLFGEGNTTSQITSRCRIGTGGSPTDPTWAGLEQHFATSSTRLSSSADANTEEGTVPYRTQTVLYEFPIGTFSANTELKEVGIGTSTITVNRQLIRDEDYSPITLTLQEDEGLRIETAFRVTGYAPVGERITKTVDINGDPTDIEIEHRGDAFGQGRFAPVQNERDMFIAITDAGRSVDLDHSWHGYTSGNYYRDCTLSASPGVFEDESIQKIELNLRCSQTYGVNFTLIHFTEPLGPISVTEEFKFTFRRSIAAES